MYEKKVEIRHVPVYCCDACGHHEVLANIKPLLKQYMSDQGAKPKAKKVYFNEISEYTDVLVQISHLNRPPEELDNMVQERINELLDLMNVAKRKKDDEWMKEIEARLGQLVTHSTSSFTA